MPELGSRRLDFLTHPSHFGGRLGGLFFDVLDLLLLLIDLFQHLEDFVLQDAVGHRVGVDLRANDVEFAVRLGLIQLAAQLLDLAFVGLQLQVLLIGEHPRLLQLSLENVNLGLLFRENLLPGFDLARAMLQLFIEVLQADM